MMQEYRYEHKFVIHNTTALLLKQQLRCVMELDKHSVSEDLSYQIRSLYFDDDDSSAYYEKLNGDTYRKKYRIRIYNQDTSFLRLECKHKDAEMTFKEECTLSKEQYQQIINGNYDAVQTEDAFLLQFLTEAKAHHLRPSVLVDYDRLAFTYPTSEVRITFDEHLRSGRYCTRLDDFDASTFALFPDDQCVLEVKCNEYIPDHILSILYGVPMIHQAVSKFALCRSIF